MMRVEMEEAEDEGGGKGSEEERKWSRDNELRPSRRHANLRVNIIP